MSRSSHFFVACYYLVLISMAISCSDNSLDESPSSDDSRVQDLLDSFFSEHGGKSAFRSNQVLALEALLLAQEDIEAGKMDQARKRIDQVFDAMPLSENIWRGISLESHCAGCPYNIGSPVAYYGLRMLKQVVTLDNPERSESLTMTAVVARCAKVSRPTLPNLTPEQVDLNIAPEILSEDGRLLHISTALFRRWVQAITGGMKVNLKIHVLEECTTVGYTDNGKVIVSYPDAQSMINAVPNSVAQETDFWWVIAPSGVPGNGSGYNRHFITGGMGTYGAGLPLFLSDDAWFIRIPEHMGIGPYHEVEVRAYQPQWFQHEFTHHLYRKWPEFGLEITGHQWFDRSTWPADFQGKWESDYYAESITKRLLNATPSLAQGLKAPALVDFNGIDPSVLIGRYQRKPILNQWHEVEIVSNNGTLRWQNAAGVSWSLIITNGELWTGADCVYGVQKLTVLLGPNKEITSVYFNREPYTRIK